MVLAARRRDGGGRGRGRQGGGRLKSVGGGAAPPVASLGAGFHRSARAQRLLRSAVAVPAPPPPPRPRAEGGQARVAGVVGGSIASATVPGFTLSSAAAVAATAGTFCFRRDWGGWMAEGPRPRRRRRRWPQCPTRMGSPCVQRQDGATPARRAGCGVRDGSGSDGDSRAVGRWRRRRRGRRRWWWGDSGGGGGDRLSRQ